MLLPLATVPCRDSFTAVVGLALISKYPESTQKRSLSPISAWGSFGRNVRATEALRLQAELLPSAMAAPIDKFAVKPPHAQAHVKPSGSTCWCEALASPVKST